MTDRSLIYNLGAVFICVLCFFTAQKPQTGHLQAAGIAGQAYAAGLPDIHNALRDIARETDLEVIPEKEGVRLRIYTNNMFRISRAELSVEARAALKALSMRLRVYAPGHVHIEGHTSDEPTNTPQYPNNWYLSSARAIAVGMYLINEAGFDAKRITAEGRGASEPLDAEDKSKNNRIEIIVTP